MPLLEGRPLRLAVTGREGQVVRALQGRAPLAGVEVVALGRPELDLTKPRTIASALAAARPDALVNAAAFTNVDQAESEPELALEINGVGAGAVAQAAAALGVPVLQLSTDYVFNGEGEKAYTEDEPVDPINAYGRSKLAGERAVAAATADHVILRTAWVYSPYGRNFVKTMLRLATSRDTVTVVDDQHGCPTSAADIADALVVIARNLCKPSRDADLRGVFHMAGGAQCTWADFARAVFAISGETQGPVAKVVPVASSRYPTAARRPGNSRLDSTKLARTHGVRLPPWMRSLRPCVAQILARGIA